MKLKKAEKASFSRNAGIQHDFEYKPPYLFRRSANFPQSLGKRKERTRGGYRHRLAEASPILLFRPFPDSAASRFGEVLKIPLRGKPTHMYIHKCTRKLLLGL
jgi:hypothetical protein